MVQVFHEGAKSTEVNSKGQKESTDFRKISGVIIPWNRFRNCNLLSSEFTNWMRKWYPRQIKFRVFILKTRYWISKSCSGSEIWGESGSGFILKSQFCIPNVLVRDLVIEWSEVGFKLNWFWVQVLEAQFRNRDTGWDSSASGKLSDNVENITRECWE